MAPRPWLQRSGEKGSSTRRFPHLVEEQDFHAHVSCHGLLYRRGRHVPVKETVNKKSQLSSAG